MVWVWQNRVSLQNKGLATWQRGVLVSQQAATLVNYDTLNLSASSPWVTGRPVTPLPLRHAFVALSSWTTHVLHFAVFHPPTHGSRPYS